MTNRDIAVVGIGCRFPDAPDAEQFWKNIEAGRDSFGPIPADRWDHDVFYSKNGRDFDKTWTASGAFLDDIASFSPLHYGIAPRRLEVMDPQHRLLIETTRVAIQDAGYEVNGFDRGRTGVFCGLSVSEYKNMMLGRLTAMQLASGRFGPSAGTPELRDAIMEMTRNLVPIRAFSISGALTNMAAASISQTFDLGGPSYSIDAACASASVAVYDAVSMLRAGQIDIGLAGGAYLNLTPDNLVGFTRVGAISRTGACRPFDASADGFVQGEGVGMLFLKRLDDALASGDRVYAVIKGAGCNNDGRGEGPMTPRVEGQLAALRAAYVDGDVSPASVAFFEAHGTGTSVGDPVEIESLGRLLVEAGVDRDTAPFVGSVKGNVGHTMSTAGLAGLIKAIKIAEHRVAPPQPFFETPHPKLKLDQWPVRICSEVTPLNVDGPLRVATSSFGFGGTNAHFVVQEAPRSPQVASVGIEEAAPAAPEAVLVSAPTLPLLVEHLRALAGDVTRHSLRDVAYTLNTCRRQERIRAVITADSTAKLAAAMTTAADKLDGKSPKLPARAGVGVTVYDRGAADAEAPRLAFMFPGQGAQKLGLLDDVRTRLPAFAANLAALESSCAGLIDKPLTSYLYPEVTDEAAEAALTATEICQPAMAALGVALAQTLRELGVEPVVSLGHSLGEFAALADGGVFDPADAVRLVARRGRAMADLALEDRGAMAAAMADADAVNAVIDPIDGVAVANFNRPGQVTISGTTPAVEAACEALTAAEIKAVRLQVSHAFHSPLLSEIGDTIAELLEETPLSAPRNVVASCIADAPHGDEASTRQTLVAHATAPVVFTGALQQAYDAGARVFVQVGAGGMLTGFARATLGRGVITPVNLGSTDPDQGLELVRGLVTLAALGTDVQLGALYEGAQVVTLSETPLQRDRFWLVREDAQPLPRLDQPVTEGKFGAVQVEGTAPAADGPTPSSDLVALFKQQADLLEQHARILADQNRVLLGEGASSTVADRVQATLQEPATSTTPVKAPAAAAPKAPVETPAAAPEPKEDVRERVFEIVAKVSAFPRDSLRGDQRLVDELGFDSLMVADLGSGLDSAYPALNGLPQSLFSARTTVADIADHVVEAIERGPVAESDAPRAPLSVYRVEAVATPRPEVGSHSVDAETWLVTDHGVAAAEAATARLTERGAKVIRVHLTDDGVAASDRITAEATNVWPATFTEGLPAALAAASVVPDGVLHFAGGDAPLLSLHPLAAAIDAPRVGVVTSMGGKLGLEPGAAADENIEHGAVLGYTKALARERVDRVIRALDIDPRDGASGAWAVDELLSGDLGPEVGCQDNLRYTPELVEEDLPDGGDLRKDVVLITGGAGQIGRKVALDLASAGAKAVILCGRRTESTHLTEVLAEIQSRGATAWYRPADAADAEALAAIGREAAEKLGPVTVAVHAAGYITDAPVDQTSAESLQSILQTKAGGHRALRGALPQLRSLVSFSSWAGRFGNAGQTGYAAANELLDRVAISDSKIRELSIDWPPWSSTDMVESIPTTIKNAMISEGVTFVDDDEGVAVARALIGGSQRGLRLIGRALPARRVKVLTEQTLSLATHPFLDDHRLPGTGDDPTRGNPVLPLASATDLILHGARAALATDQPIAVEGLELVRGIEVLDEVKLQVVGESDGGGAARMSILADGQLAYRATARVDEERPIEATPLDGTDEPLPFDLATFYREHTFHGPLLQGIERIDAMTQRGIRGVVTPTAIERWIPKSQRPAWSIDPLALDSSFQLAGYWAWVHHRRAGYPIGFSKLRLLRPLPDGPIHCVVTLQDADEDRFVCTIRYQDADGAPYAIIESLEGRLAAVQVEEETTSAAADVPRSSWDIAAFEEVKNLDQRLQMAELIGLKNPYFSVHDGTAKNTTVIEGREFINYSSYNYLGFSGHPEVVAAANEASERYGTSVSASRVASGERPLHRDLEKGLAEHVGVDDALVFVSGHATNVTTVGHMLDKNDIIFHDALIHDSILQGVYLSGAARRPFPHGDLDALDRTMRQIRGNYRRAMICAEGIYSMDGDICDLPGLIELKKRHKALLMIDEAHSTGVLGHAGRGVAHHFEGVNPRDVDIWMGTLSKSFSSCGGFIAGSSALIRYLKYTAPGFVYSAGITPANAAAALRSLEMMHAQPEIVEQLRQRSMFFLKSAKARGIDTGLAVGAAVVPAIVGNSMDCMKLSAALADRGINVQPIVYPAVEDDAARLRFFLSATHTEAQIEHTLDVLAEELTRIRGESAQGPSLSL